MNEEPKILREQLNIYIPWNLREEIRTFITSNKLPVSLFISYATVKLMDDIKSGKVDISEVKEDMENRLSKYYRVIRKLTLPEENHDQNKEVIQR